MQAQMPAGGMSALERLRGRLPEDLHDRLRSAREYGRAGREAAALSSTAEPLRTALAALDELLAGGLPRGQMVEVIGARSSGRFSAVLAALATATQSGEAAALVDLGDGLDPQAAAEMGVDLQRLLWLRPTTFKQALAATEIAIGGGFPMVVLDLGNPPLQGTRGMEAGWLRLARAAQAQATALLIASPYRVSGTAAAAVLQAARGRARWLGHRTGGPWLLDGLSCRLTLEKSRGSLLASQGRSSGLELEVAPLPEPLPTPLAPAAPTVASPLAPAAASPLTLAGPRSLAQASTSGVAPAGPRSRPVASASAVASSRIPTGENGRALRHLHERGQGHEGGGGHDHGLQYEPGPPSGYEHDQDDAQPYEYPYERQYEAWQEDVQDDERVENHGSSPRRRLTARAGRR